MLTAEAKDSKLSVSDMAIIDPSHHKMRQNHVNTSMTCHQFNDMPHATDQLFANSFNKQ